MALYSIMSDRAAIVALLGLLVIVVNVNAYPATNSQNELFQSDGNVAEAVTVDQTATKTDLSTDATSYYRDGYGGYGGYGAYGGYPYYGGGGGWNGGGWNGGGWNGGYGGYPYYGGGGGGWNGGYGGYYPQHHHRRSWYY